MISVNKANNPKVREFVYSETCTDPQFIGKLLVCTGRQYHSSILHYLRVGDVFMIVNDICFKKSGILLLEGKTAGRIHFPTYGIQFALASDNISVTLSNDTDHGRG